ncbi:Regulator of RpoS [subsurface metagenome]
MLHGENGREAFSLVKKEKPLLLISDIVMPVMDGYELCKKVKTDTDLEDIPVMLLTTLSDPADIIKGLDSKADNFIVKPPVIASLCIIGPIAGKPPVGATPGKDTPISAPTPAPTWDLTIKLSTNLPTVSSRSAG